jgi:hypothetical protein
MIACQSNLNSGNDQTVLVTTATAHVRFLGISGHTDLSLNDQQPPQQIFNGVVLNGRECVYIKTKPGTPRVQFMMLTTSLIRILFNGKLLIFRSSLQRLAQFFFPEQLISLLSQFLKSSKLHKI